MTTGVMPVVLFYRLSDMKIMIEYESESEYKWER